MSDVSKTNEALINEAREFLASENAQYYDSSLVRSLVDALEAATRVPVQGEPNDDRRAAMAEADRRFPEAVFAPENEQLAEIFLSGAEFVLARAAVPDAATERERSDLWQSLDWMLWGVGMGDVFREPLADKMIRSLSDEEFDKAQDLIRGWDKLRGGPIERNLFVELKTERDAALAAVERVRAVLSAWEMVQARNREYLESGNPGMIVPIDCTGGLRAALDGAPEPEVKP